MTATPLEIDIALWYHVRSGDYGADNGDNNFHASAVQDTLHTFVKLGFLKRNEPNPDLPQRFYGTEGLRVYVEALCEMPWPEQQWVMPESHSVALMLRRWGAGRAGGVGFKA